MHVLERERDTSTSKIQILSINPTTSSIITISSSVPNNSTKNNNSNSRLTVALNDNTLEEG